MLEHLSPKFKMPPMEREPRAALILNRFTRGLSIMFATNAVSTILGMRPDEIKDKSFYECIQENCLQDAIQCLESAKANESIAYLRFWLRDPRIGDEEETDQEVDEEDEEEDEEDEDEEEEKEERERRDDTEDEQFSEAGRRLDDSNATSECGCGGSVEMELDDESPPTTTNRAPRHGVLGIKPRSPRKGKSPAFPYPLRDQSFDGSVRPSSVSSRTSGQRPWGRPRATEIPCELEAVVSCTSDGLVVVLRKARPPVPPPHPPLLPALNFENGLFAAPWGQQPIRPSFPPNLLYTFRPPLLPQYMPLRESVKAAGGPPLDQLMKSIRDVAVFAWALVGINGNMAAYSHGLPRGQAQPVHGPPSWELTRGNARHPEREEQSHDHWVAPNGVTDTVAPGTHYRHDAPYFPPEVVQHAYGQPSSILEAQAGPSSSSAWPRSTAPSFGLGGYELADERRQPLLQQPLHQQPQPQRPFQDPFSQMPPSDRVHYYTGEQQQPRFSSLGELRGDASSSRAYGSQDQPIPAPRAPNPNGASQGFGHMWR